MPATETTATGSGRDLSNLDVLRTVAVVSVLVSHVVGALRSEHFGAFYGAFGVGLFFVHTALVLMWSLERRPHALDFYIRRIARIYPLSIAVLLIALSTHAKVSSFQEHGEFFLHSTASAKQVMTHLLLVQNLFSGNFIVYPMWSLPIEVQMYALLPVLFFFLRKHMRLWPLLLLWALAAGCALRMFGPQDINLAVAVPYFLPGIMAYVGFARRKATLPGWSLVPALAVVVWAGGQAGNWQRAWLPCLALGLMLPSFRQMRRNVFTKICWHIARYSYGIYMTHPFSLLLAFYVCRNYSRPVQFAVLFLSLAVFSFVGFHWIEAPFMRLGAKFAGRIFARAQVDTTKSQSSDGL